MTFLSLSITKYQKLTFFKSYKNIFKNHKNMYLDTKYIKKIIKICIYRVNHDTLKIHFFTSTLNFQYIILIIFYII